MNAFFPSILSRLRAIESREIAYDNGVKTLKFNGDATGKETFQNGLYYYVLVSNSVINPGNVTVAKVSSDYGVFQTYEGYELSYSDIDSNRIAIKNLSGLIGIIIVKNDYTDETGTPIQKGTYFVDDKDGVLLEAHVWMSEVSYKDFKQIDKEFIPPVDSLIINSSTEGSTKQFMVTVDDAGAITATEVT